MDEQELKAIVELVESEYLLGPSDAKRLVAAVRALTLANAELHVELARLAAERDALQDALASG
jgi:hypothetical protein